jgi:hypothetical protein
MKSFRTIIAAVAFVALTQVQAETPALRGLDETKNAPNAVDVDQPGRYISARSGRTTVSHARE